MTILVPYDGSQQSQRAAEYALGHTDGEELVLLRVIEMADGVVEAGIDILQEKLEAIQEEKTGELSEELKSRLRESDAEFRVETAVGKPVREIVEFAETHDVSTIIVGSHGRESASRVLLGSVAEGVVRRAPVTVTVVR